MTDTTAQPTRPSPAAHVAKAPAFSLCVYCGARAGEQGNDAAHAARAAAQAVGHWIGRRGGQLVYGGGRTGLMGMVADATQAAGGRVLGVIPGTLDTREITNHRCDELHIVANMHQRKAMMAERCDAFLALPGGLGTLEELFEVWTWRQLGIHHKPIGLLNTGNYFDALLHFLGQCSTHGFMRGTDLDMVHVSANHDTLLPQLVHAAQHSSHSTTMRLCEI